MRHRNRGRVYVEENENAAVLNISATNWFARIFLLILGAMAFLACVGLALSNWRAGDAVSAVFLCLIAISLGVGIWRFVSTPKVYTIHFGASGLRVGKTTYAYADIQSFGVDVSGAAPFDPASMPIPQNLTPGSHIYLETGGQMVPISIGLEKETARHALKQFTLLYQRFSAF
jgi:hypothetical protein